MFKRSALATLLVAGLALTANAETFKIDRGHSNVGFEVTHFGISKVKGGFSEFSGTIQFDPADVSKSSVEVTISAPSIDTKSEGRDRHLRSGDFFAADSFPVITFKSTKVTAKADKTFEVVGDLTMRGVTKPVTLNAELVGEFVHPERGKMLGFSAEGTFNRQDWGVTWNSTLETGGLVVSNDVDIVLDIEAIVVKEKPAN